MPRPASKTPITEPFTDLLAEAMVAYTLDSSYAAAMCASATRILHKRVSWQARTDLRATSAAAVAECAKLPEFANACSNPSPCGVGAGCRFSTGELAVLQIEPKPGKSLRPQPHRDGPTYDVEAAVKELVTLREGPRRAA